MSDIVIKEGILKGQGKNMCDIYVRDRIRTYEIFL